MGNKASKAAQAPQPASSNMRLFTTGKDNWEASDRECKAGRHQHAIEYGRAAVRYNQGYAAAAQGTLGWSFYGLADYTTAINHFNLAIQSSDLTMEGRQLCLNGIGWSNYHLKKYQQGIESFTTAAGLDSKNLSNYLGLGWCHYFLENYSKALTPLNKIFEENDTYSNARYIRGCVLRQLGNYSQAMVDFNKAAQFDQSDKLAYYGRAYVYLAQDDFQQAMREVNKTLSLDPNFYPAYNLRAAIRRKLGEHNLALDDANTCINGDSTAYYSYVTLGLIYIELGQLAPAIRNIEQAHTLKPNYSFGCTAKGRYYAALAKAEENSTTRQTYYRRAKENYELALAGSLGAKEKQETEVDLATVSTELQKSLSVSQPSRTTTFSSTASTSAFPPSPPHSNFSAQSASGMKQTNQALITSRDFQVDYNKRLGSGGFGVVYQGTWSMTPVAIKKLHATELSEETLTNFKEEARLHAPLRHPNIVTLWGVCIEAGNYSMVMELMMAGSLYQLLHSRAELPWTMRLSIARHITIGLHYLHEHHIIHRDLKSLNVLLDQHGQAKLADFGLSTVKSETSRTTKIEEKSSSGQAPGTICWMAPELFKRGGKCTTASDIYALGVTFWELSSRKAPFQDENHAGPEVMMHWIKEGDLDEVPKETPPKFATLILQCRAKEPSNRLPSAVAIANVLAQADVISNAQEQSQLDSGYRWKSNT